jgi:iron complex transport system substrate-binding protein
MAAAMLMTTLLGGCGGTSSTSSTSSTSAAAAASTAASAASETAETITVTDFTGEEKTIPAYATSIATLVGPSYEKVFMLGEADRIAYTMEGGSKRSSWALYLNPALADIPGCSSPDDPNLEEMSALGVDLVFYWNTPDVLDAMEQANIPALAALPGTDNSPTTVDEFLDVLKQEVRLYGTALGEEASAKAELWCSWVDEKYAYVTERLADVDEADYPTVHIVGGSDIYNCFADKSYPDFYIEMAGGKLVTGDSSETTCTLEQILSWDPDYIFMGRQSSKDVILEDAGWQTLTAVQEDRVYMTPNGVFYWDYDSEGMLLVLYTAKTIHPDLFEDLDMIEEVQYYYSTFYGYDLTDEEAQLILDHQDPPQE